MRKLITLRQLIQEAEDSGDSLDDLAVDESDVVDLSDLDADTEPNQDEED